MTLELEASLDTVSVCTMLGDRKRERSIQTLD
jgi:hypothetical protein